jgi:hypothetical protein
MSIESDLDAAFWRETVMWCQGFCKEWSDSADATRWPTFGMRRERLDPRISRPVTHHTQSWQPKQQ